MQETEYKNYIPLTLHGNERGQRVMFFSETHVSSSSLFPSHHNAIRRWSLGSSSQCCFSFIATPERHVVSKKNTWLREWLFFLNLFPLTSSSSFCSPNTSWRRSLEWKEILRRMRWWWRTFDSSESLLSNCFTPTNVLKEAFEREVVRIKWAIV